MEIIKDPRQNLSKVWIAAHWDKKLTKHTVLAHNIQESVDTIKSPENALALRIAGSLLFGIVKLLLKKVVYIMIEAEDLSNQVTFTFNNQTGDKSKPGIATARNNLITLSNRKSRKSLQSFDGMISTASIMNTTQPSIEVPRNIASRDQITMRDLELTPLSGKYSAEKFRNIQIDMSSNFLDDVAETLHESQLGMDLNPEINLTPLAFQDDRMDIELPLEPILEVISPNKPNSYDINMQIEEPKLSLIKYQPINKKKKLQSLKRKWREDDDILLAGYDEYEKDTTDILTHHHYKNYRDSEIPIEYDKIFFEPILKGMHLQLEDFYHAPSRLESVKWISAIEDSVQQDYEQEMIKYDEQQDIGYDYDINPIPDDFIPPLQEDDMQLEHNPDQQELQNNTDSQIDLNTRTAKMLGLVKAKLKSARSITYGKICEGQDKQSIACGFYELLNLTKKGFVNLSQRREMGDITIKISRSLSAYNL